MSRWTDPAGWLRLLRPEGYPICTQGRPHNVIAELEVSWLTMGEEPAVLPGTYPRYRGDPFEGKPIDPRLPTSTFGPPVEHGEVRRRVIAELNRAGD